MPFSEALSKLLAQRDLQKIKLDVAFISECYKNGGTLRCQEHLLAYLLVRMPATFAVLCEVLKQVRPGSVLDLGAGPGTSWWAAQEAWQIKPNITALEREYGFIQLGKQLKSEAVWQQANLLLEPQFEPHDWVLFSYSLGELPENALLKLLTKSWLAASLGVIIIEPGTPKGFKNIQSARDILVKLGGHCMAPCPHSRSCPLKAPAWCHFSVRLERSRWHQLAKSATLSYEDEKYSYVILTKEPQIPPSRVLHTPQLNGGHVILELCTQAGLERKIIPRSNKELYKIARKTKWGESFCSQ